MRSHFYHSASGTLILKNANEVRILDGAQTVSDNNGSALSAALLNKLVKTGVNNLFTLVIQSTSRFIQDQNLWVAQ